MGGIFQDKVALITGAASGLGFACAMAFAREGARLVLNDLDDERAKTAAARIEGDHLACSGNVSKEADVSRLTAEAVSRFGRIDILVNSAGLADSFVPTVDQPLEHWQKLIDVHLTGTYLVSKTVAPVMIAQRSGAIINLNSIAGVLGLPVRTTYSVAKAGIGMMTRVLGCEWAPYGVRVNAIAPGYIMTPMTERLIDAGKIDVDRVRRRTPMGLLGTAEDIADGMMFLASDRSRFITGVTLPIDGGYCAFGAPSDAYPLEDLPATLT